MWNVSCHFFLGSWVVSHSCIAVSLPFFLLRSHIYFFQCVYLAFTFEDVIFNQVSVAQLPNITWLNCLTIHEHVCTVCFSVLVHFHHLFFLCLLAIIYKHTAILHPLSTHMCIALVLCVNKWCNVHTFNICQNCSQFESHQQCSHTLTCCSAHTGQSSCKKMHTFDTHAHQCTSMLATDSMDTFCTHHCIECTDHDCFTCWIHMQTNTYASCVRVRGITAFLDLLAKIHAVFEIWQFFCTYLLPSLQCPCIFPHRPQHNQIMNQIHINIDVSQNMERQNSFLSSYRLSFIIIHSDLTIDPLVHGTDMHTTRVHQHLGHHTPKYGAILIYIT